MNRSDRRGLEIGLSPGCRSNSLSVTETTQLYRATDPTGQPASLPITLCIDVEPDAHVFPLEAPSGWSGFQYMLERMRRLRDALERLTDQPVHFGWDLRMDPQIALGFGSATYLADRYSSELEQLVDEGDAIGLHTHAWRWDDTARAWIADHLNQQWVDECLAIAVGSYRESIGGVPGFHRFGAQFMSTDTMNLLRTLGIPIDMTIEPGEPPNRDATMPGTIWTGKTGDFRRAMRSPYIPSPDDYRIPSPKLADSLWELPLTSARYSSWFRTLPHSWSRRLRPTRMVRGLRHRLGALEVRELLARSTTPGGDRANGHRLLAMWSGQPEPKKFWGVAFSAAAELEHPYLAFAIRTDTGSDAGLLKLFDAIFASFEYDHSSRHVRFATPSETLQILNSNRPHQSPM